MGTSYNETRDQEKKAVVRMVVRSIGLLRRFGRSGLVLERHVSILLRISLGNRIRSGPGFLRVAASAGKISSQCACITTQRNDPLKQLPHPRSPIDVVERETTISKAPKTDRTPEGWC